MTYAIVNEEPASIKNFVSDVPEKLEQFFGKALAKEPQARFDRADDVIDNLEALKKTVEVPIANTNSSDPQLSGQTGGRSKIDRSTLPGLSLRENAFGRRGILIGAVTLMVLALMAGWWVMGGETDGDNISIDEDKVAVLPFTVRGSEDLSYLHEGMVELMSRSIDGAGPLRVVDPKALLTQIKLESTSDEVGPEAGNKLAEKFDAGRYILGSILRLGKDIRLSATWYGAEGEEIGSAEAIANGEEEIQEGIDALARRAISDLADEAASHRQRLAAETTSSSEALKAYLEGQKARRSYKWQAAQNAFKRAVDIDSSFALAYYGLSWAAGWNFKVNDALSAASRAVGLSENLPERDQLVIKAHNAFFQGRADKAERLYRQVIETYPGDVNAWHGLGETLFHFNTTRGRTVMGAKEPLEQAVELDPSHSEPLMHLVHIAAMEQDLDAIDSLTAIPERRNLMGAFQKFFRDIRAFVFEEEPIPEAEKLNEMGTLYASIVLSGLGRLEKAKEPLRLLASVARSRDTEAVTHFILARILALEGRFDEAREELKVIKDMDKAAYLITRAKLALLPFIQDSIRAGEEQSYLLNQLTTRNVDTTYEHSRNFLTPPPKEAYPLFRLYLLGLLHSVKGDNDKAREIAGDLNKQSSPKIFFSLSSDLSRGVMAEAARQEGDNEEALNHLKNLKLQASLGFNPFYTGARERFLRAELLAKAKQYKEALAWYNTFDITVWDNYPYVAPAHLARARILEKLGKNQEAADAYKRFIELYVNADSVLQPMIRTAGERLEQLSKNNTLVEK